MTECNQHYRLGNHSNLCDIRHIADREYLHKCLKVVETKMTANDSALAIANREAEKQYIHLNNLRATMVSFDVYRVEYKSINDKIEGLTRLIYIGVGILLAVQAFLYFMK